MAKKHSSTWRANAGSSHGNFKHKSKGTNLKTVLAAYNLKNSDYQRVRCLVVGQLPKELVHGR